MRDYTTPEGPPVSIPVVLAVVIVLVVVNYVVEREAVRRRRHQMTDTIRNVLTCPIANTIMRDPVTMVQTGITFDRESLSKWLVKNPKTCPVANVDFHEHLRYVDGICTRQLLIQYLGEDSYQPYDDSYFREQYQATMVETGTPMSNQTDFFTFDILSSYLYGMNRQKIDWVTAQRMATNERSLNAIMVGFKGLLLHPDFQKGRRLEKDENEAKMAWTRAEELGLSALVDAGNAWAQWIKAMLSDIIAKDYESAKNMHQLAANQGNPLAQNSLGAFYEDDDDFGRAEELYKQAADQGHALAQYNLAMLYEPDFGRMKPHLEHAASQGYDEALFYLGSIYVESDVAEQDYETAKQYFELAAKQGHCEAKKSLEKLLQVDSSSGFNPIHPLAFT
jgi:hypothetical protein